MDIVTIIGTIGAIFVLIGFVLNEFGKLTAQSFIYDLLNLIGSTLLLWYGLELSAWPFVFINSVWLLVSLRDVIKGLARRAKNS